MRQWSTQILMVFRKGEVILVIYEVNQNVSFYVLEINSFDVRAIYFLEGASAPKPLQQGWVPPQDRQPSRGWGRQ